MFSVPDTALVALENNLSGNVTIRTADMASRIVFSVLCVLTYVAKNDSVLVGIVV